jgi:hypothetical protein
MEKDIYNMIDKFLIQLEESPVGVRIPFDRYSPKGMTAIKLMLKHDLAEFRTNDIPSIDIVQKNLNGTKVLEVSGFDNWISENNLKKSKKESLEIKKLEFDVKNSERIYKTYWWTFGIAVGAFLISTTLLILKISESNQQQSAKKILSVKPVNVKRLSPLK